MPKILQVSTRHNIGGISKLIIELLGDSNFEQVYVTGVCEKNEKEYSLEPTSSIEGNYKFIRIQRLKRSINLINDFLAFYSLVRIICKEKPDIIHTHMSKAGLIARIAALTSKKKIKTVHSYHGHVFDGYFKNSIARVIVCIERILGHSTDAFVFDGNQTKHEINAYKIRPKKIQQVILPGLVRNVFIANQKLTQNDKLKILVVARIERVKRIDLVLSVARCLNKNHPTLDYEIEVVGDGELRQLYEQQAKAELLQVKFSGWVDNVNEYYEYADLLLSTSDSEGTPIAFMEAASFGCPIISTNVGSVADLVDDRKTGILCEKHGEIIAEEIFNLWANQPLFLEYSQNSLLKASSDFSVDLFKRRHADLYRALIA